MTTKIKKQTYRERTLDLETVKFGLSHGYVPRIGNKTAVRHFAFVYYGIGSPEIEVNWFKGLSAPDEVCITIGQTVTNNDKHALTVLKGYW